MSTPEPTRTQVVVASTAFGLATLTAAQRSGLLPPADHRVLVCTNNAGVPETTTGLLEVAGTAELAAAYDAVVDLNEALYPLHPAAWAPREIDLPVWERFLRARWGLEGPVELVLESIQADPALALSRVFAESSIDVYADGLMSYGPTRIALPDAVGARTRRVLHLDLVPGLRPLLLREFGAETAVIPTEAFTAVLAGLDEGGLDVVARDDTGHPAPDEPVALLLGQYLADAGILTADEETALHREMVHGAVAAGFRRLEFKAHPSAGSGQADTVREAAAQAGATLVVARGAELAEARFRRGGIGLVVGCFSTALATARFYDLPVARVGTELLLERLTPYENSNRIPVTLVHAGVPALAGRGGCADHRPPPRTRLALDDLVATVAYCMQPRRNPDLRERAVAVLTEHLDTLRPYVKRRRLTRLDLPGRGPKQPPVAAAVRRAVSRLGRPGRAQGPARRAGGRPPRPATR